MEGKGRAGSTVSTQGYSGEFMREELGKRSHIGCYSKVSTKL